ncbi:hypothetical protein BH10CYA1_BH10CYA1_47330 [soil metagenome]
MSMPAAYADGTASSGASGVYGRTSARTSTQGVSYRNTLPTLRQTAARRLASTAALGGIFSAATRNGLPSTNLDSFVTQAAGNAELIYGDEGVVGLPPYNDFTKEHRINHGIYDVRAKGLSTGHSSILPDAWGGDEFVKGPEFDMSGNGSTKITPVQYGAPNN